MDIGGNVERIVELDDSAIVTQILHMSFITVAIQFNFTKEKVPFFPAFITEDIIENQMSNGLKMYGYDISGKVVACIGYSQMNETTALIERFATMPDYRHFGIGKKLMTFIENKIKEAGGEIAEIHVISINEELIEWYVKLGYKIIRMDKLADGDKKLPFDLCVMNRKL
jgi:ribosomal protein S18 acetylase RimI-like enzyme